VNVVWYTATVESFVEMHESGLTLRECAKRLGWSLHFTRSEAKRLGVLRSPSDRALLWRRARSSIRLDAFRRLDERAAYWLGFLFADGHIPKNTAMVTCELSDKDYSHIEKLRDFMGGGSILRGLDLPKTSRTASRISICSKDVAMDVLALFGSRLVCDRDHSVLSRIDESLWRHFFRGLIDGDGSIVVPGRGLQPSVELVGWDSYLPGFASAVAKSAGVHVVQVESKAANKAHRVRWSGTAHCRRVCDWLYDGATVFLDRKKSKADLIPHGTQRKVWMSRCPICLFSLGPSCRRT
jgi:hypothetical protein